MERGRARAIERKRKISFGSGVKTTRTYLFVWLSIDISDMRQKKLKCIYAIYTRNNKYTHVSKYM